MRDFIPHAAIGEMFDRDPLGARWRCESPEQHAPPEGRGETCKRLMLGRERCRPEGGRS